MSGTAFAQAMPIVFTPIFARLYTPEEYSRLGIFIAQVSVVNVILLLRYEFSILLPKEDRDANKIYMGNYIILIFTVFISTIGLYIYNYRFDNSNWDTLTGILITFYLISYGIILNSTFILNRMRNYKRISLAKVFRAIVIIILNFSMLWLDRSRGLIYAYVLGTLIESIILLRGDPMLKKMKDFTFDYRLNLKYRKFPLIDMPSALINAASWQIPFFILPIYFNDNEIGQFFQAVKIVGIPVTFIASSIGQVYFKELSICKTSESAFILTKTVILRLSLISSCIFVPAAFLFPVIMPLALGPEWSLAGKLASWLSLWILFQLVTSSISSVFNVYGLQMVAMVINIVLLLLRFSLLFFWGGDYDIVSLTMRYSVYNALVYFIVLLLIFYISKTRKLSYA